MDNFWFNEIIKGAVLFLTAYFLGLWVIKRGVRVNYTRKIFHFVLFFFPIYLATVLPFQASLLTVLMSGGIFLLCIGTLIEPFRARSVFLSTVFASIDRPEDRPHTLVWISTQVLATYVVLIAMLAWLSRYDAIALIYITVLVAGVGDGLAEPIGIRYGKRSYSVSALFTDKKYVRTLEGSLCVFVSGILAIILLQGQLTSIQFVLSMIIIPLSMTLAEAKSPHTWDAPFLYLIGGTSTVAVLELSKWIDRLM